MMVLPWLLRLLRVLIIKDKGIVQQKMFASLSGLLLLCYCALIIYLSHHPMLPVPDLFSIQDKIIHATAYALMALLFWNSGRYRLAVNRSFTSAHLAVVSVVFCALFGAGDEWHQSFVAGRDASIFDWLADLFGACLLTLTLYKREVGLQKKR